MSERNDPASVAERWQYEQAGATWRRFLRGEGRTVSRAYIRRILARAVAPPARGRAEHKGAEAMSAKKTTAASARPTEVEALRSLVRAFRLEQQALVRRVERMVAGLVCRKCGHLAEAHYWRISDLCDRCLRDHGPAKGYRSRSNRHRLQLKEGER